MAAVLFRSARLHEEDAMIVADVSFIDIFWSMLWFFFLFIWIVILAHIVSDLFRDHSLSAVTKTLWVLFLVFLPFVAAFVYLIVRGQGMAERSAAQQQRAQEQFAGYVRNVAATGDATPTEQIARAKELLDAGTINQSEFDRLKAKALS
jgi:membrane protein implicated in regulation of membrane protease activity